MKISVAAPRILGEPSKSVLSPKRAGFRYSRVAGAIGLAMFVAAGVCPAQKPTPPANATPPTSPLARALQATVFIETDGVQGKASGSGFIVDGGGKIVTAAHVINGAATARVKLATGEVYDVVGVLAYDERLDIAILAIAGFGLPEMPLGNSDSVSVGQRVLALGSPLGLENTVSDGLLSAIRMDAGSKLLQVSAPISHGSSGGPVITEAGAAIGIAVSGASAEAGQNLNFAVPINYARGQLGVVNGRLPTPLSQMKYGAIAARGRGLLGGEESGVGSPPTGSAPTGLSPVNDSLVFDWNSLNGLEILSKSKGEHQIRYSDLIRYGISLDPAGVVVVERKATRRIRNQGWVAGVDIAKATTELVFHASGINSFSVDYDLRPLISGLSPEQSQLEVQGSRYIFAASGALPKQGDAPPGVLPAMLSGGAIAALSGPLPDHIRLWVLNVPGSGVSPAVYDFTSTETEEIPLAQEGTNCSDDQQVTNTSMRVRVGTLSMGTDREAVTVLDDAPHVAVMGVTCLMLPGHSPPRQQVHQAPTKPIR